jgi:ATP-dependent DNA ligase
LPLLARTDENELEALMRVIESKRNPKSGELYHYCPKTQDVAHKEDCVRCLLTKHEGSVEWESTRWLPADTPPGVGAGIEPLRGSYKIHCPHGESVKAIIPSHVDDQLPKTMCLPGLSAFQTKFKLVEYTVLEPKKDGVRCVTKVGCVTNRCFSRNNTKFGDQSEFTDNVPQLKNLTLPDLAETIFDGELLVDGKGEDSTGTLGATMTVVGSDPTKAIAAQEKWGYAHLWVFDMPLFKGIDMTNKTWLERHELLVLTISKLPPEAQKYIHIMPCIVGLSEQGKRELYKAFMEKGYEGGVLKNPRATYYELRAQLKLLEDVTLDAVVTGYEMGTPKTKYEGKLGVVKFSVIDKATGKLREVGQCIPGSDPKRDELTAKLVGKTAEEILAQNIIIWVKGKNWTKEFHIRHPAIKEYCKDRTNPSTIDFTQVERR